MPAPSPLQHAPAAVAIRQGKVSKRARAGAIPPHTIVRATGCCARGESIRIGGEAYTVTADLGEWHAPDGRRGRITHLRRWDGVKSQHVLVEADGVSLGRD
jgi:hypothetical protein